MSSQFFISFVLYLDQRGIELRAEGGMAVG